MRNFLNGILTFLSIASLTDEEFSTVNITVQQYNIDTYNQLKEILELRESVSDDLDRLRYYFLAKGVEIDQAYTPKSNILIGRVL